MNMLHDRGIFDHIPTSARPFWVSDVNITPRTAAPMHDRSGKSGTLSALWRALTRG